MTPGAQVVPVPTLKQRWQSLRWWGKLLVLLALLALLVSCCWISAGTYARLTGSTETAETAELPDDEPLAAELADEPTTNPTATVVPAIAKGWQPFTIDFVASAPQAMPVMEQVSEDGHIQRLVELDAVYRAQGLGAWLRAAGLAWTDDIIVESRQVEEIQVVLDDGSTKTVVTKVVLRTTSDGAAHAVWPAGVTTDWIDAVGFDANGGGYQPDIANPSWSLTNVWVAAAAEDESGVPFTFVADFGHLEQMWPENRTLPSTQ